MPTHTEKPWVKITSLIPEETPNTEHLPSPWAWWGPVKEPLRMLITPPTYSPALRFIFLWRSIDFLLFSLPLIPGSVSSVVLHRGAIIQGLITAPLAAYLLPGDSLFKPLPNDLGKLTCSTSQACGASLMSEGVAPMQGLLVLSKRERKTRSGHNHQHITLSSFPTFLFFSCRWPSQV